MQQTKTAPFILTVSQLTQAIKLQLESSFPMVWLKGEVSNLKVQTSGHMYFSIKDEFAQIAAVMFRQDLLKVQFPIKIGDQILVRGEMNVYPPKGNYQLIVREISLVGMGEQLIRLEMLKQKLQGLGWFNPEHKKPLPSFPKIIGVVTSPTGAVIQDILNILTRRFSGFHLILNPVKVQGDGSAEEIAQAIKQFNHWNMVDVIIVGRGGGSFEDLAAFNTELVAKAIFESKIPIVSAVGHETDYTIADLVADIRAPTPSAAAEIVSQESQALITGLFKFDKLIHNQIKQIVARKKQEILRFTKQPYFLSSIPLLGPKMQHLDDLKDALDQGMKRVLQTTAFDLSRIARIVKQTKPEVRIKENLHRLAQLEKGVDSSIFRTMSQNREALFAKNTALDSIWQNAIKFRKKRFQSAQFETRIPLLIQNSIARRKKELQRLVDHLNSLNPKNLLQKGYSILFSQKDGSVISSVEALHIGDSVQVLLKDGKLDATINQLYPELTE